MQTDFQDLKFFDAATVVLMAIGIAIVGYVVFSTLPEQGQTHVANAVVILDLHEHFDKHIQIPVESALFAMNTMQDFLDEFYLAFSQTAALPQNLSQMPVQMEKFYLAVLNYADHVAADYYFMNEKQSVLAYGGGVVSGLTTEIQPASSQIGNFQVTSSEESTKLNFPFNFSVPIKSLWQKAINNFSKIIN